MNATTLDQDIAEATRRNAMLVSMSITRFPLHVSDAAAAASAEVAAHASRGAVRAVKNRLSGADTHWKAVSAALNAAYVKHRQMTAEWGVGQAVRLLPNRQWAAYVQEVGRAQAAVAAAKTEFVRHYDADVATARTNLGDLAPSYYPSADQAARMFSLTVDFQPIASDVEPRGLPPGATEWLTDQYTKKSSINAEAATADVLRRVQEHAETLLDNVREDRRFRTSSLTNVTGLVPMIRAINFADNPQLATLADTIEGALGRYDFKTLKSAGKGALPDIQQVLDALEPFDLAPLAEGGEADLG